MAVFLWSLFVVFLAELGDKTQLVALCMATRFKASVVLAGVFVATLLVHLVSVGLGAAAGTLLPAAWISLIAGLAFLAFGMWTLRGDELEDEECQTGGNRSPFLIVAITFFLAELGDKTMLSTVTLAADNKSLLIPVWLGSSLGMVVSDGLAILVGQIMGARLPERAVKIGAALVFFAFGLWKIWEGARHLPVYAWIAGAMVVAILTLIFFRGAKTSGDAPQQDATS